MFSQKKVTKTGAKHENLVHQNNSPTIVFFYDTKPTGKVFYFKYKPEHSKDEITCMYETKEREREEGTMITPKKCSFGNQWLYVHQILAHGVLKIQARVDLDLMLTITIQ